MPPVEMRVVTTVTYKTATASKPKKRPDSADTLYRDYRIYIPARFKNLHITLIGPESARKWVGIIPSGPLENVLKDSIKIYADLDGIPRGRWSNFFTEITERNDNDSTKPPAAA